MVRSSCDLHRAALLSMVCWLAIVHAAPVTPLIVIRGGTLLDGNRVVRNAIVVIRGDRIKAVGANVKIPAGANWPVPGLSMPELRQLAAAGITPIALLIALTRDGAAAAGRRDMGTLAAGVRADIVILAADPRISVEAFDRVRTVIRHGAVVRNDLSTAKPAK